MRGGVLQVIKNKGNMQNCGKSGGHLGVSARTALLSSL